MNCTNLQQFITTYPRKKKKQEHKRCTDRGKSQDTGDFILGSSEFSFFSFLFKLKKEKKKKTRKVYQHRAWKLIYISIYFLPKQLWSSPTLLTRMASLMKHEIQKGTRLHTAKYHILALPICMVMYSVYRMSYNNNTFYKRGTASEAKAARTRIASEMTDKVKPN